MYNPPAFAESRTEVLYDLVEARPFGALVTLSPHGLFATHLPFVVDRASGPLGTLRGHVARENPHHSYAAASPPAPIESLAIFTGPEGYITPSWYATKREHGKVVPTWNYAAVHVHGTLHVIDDPAFLRDHVTALSVLHERSREHPWAVSDAPAEFIDRMLRAIVGIELRVTRLEGKWKASQNRSADDIAGVICGLSTSPDPAAGALAAMVASRSRKTDAPASGDGS